MKLRISKPDIERPYRIPLNTFGYMCLFAPTILLTLLVLGLATYTTYIFVLCVNLLGFFVLHAKKQSEHRHREQNELNGTEEVSTPADKKKAKGVD